MKLTEVKTVILEPSDPLDEAWFRGATGQASIYEEASKEYREWQNGRLEWEFLRSV